MTFGLRYLRSDKHFVGSHEEKHRQEEGSEVINDSKFFDVSVAYTVTPQLGVALTIPYVWHERSQVVRDSTGAIIQRFETQSAGVGDLRLLASYWMLDVKEHHDFNIALGLGVDMPTGKEDAKDTFSRFSPSTGQIVAEERTVDQSIQPGDGGWGVIFDAFGYWNFSDTMRLYVAGTYNLTPQEMNGVPTFRSNPFEAEMSIADTYVARIGVEWAAWPEEGLTLGVGFRTEGVMKEDLMGGSDGFRRPGYANSVEPSLAWYTGGWLITLQVPIAVYRNRVQSVPDEQFGDATGVGRHGDAAFADWMAIFTIGRSF